MKNEEISSSPMDVKSDGILELRISKRLSPTREQRFLAFRFFTKQQFCFKQIDDNWYSINYTRALDICERIVVRAYNGQKNFIIVRGTLLPHILARLGIDEPTNPAEDDKLAALKAGQKIILG